MQKTIFIDVDTDRKPAIKIGYPSNKPDMKPNPIEDMSLLCEALCTLIHATHDSKIKKDHESVKDCVDHLKKGFVDCDYKASVKSEAIVKGD